LNERSTAAILWALLVLDVALTAVAFGWPSLWFRLFHGTAAPADLLYFRRTGAQWAGFALVQAIAIVRWRHDPRWLAAVAGVRLCDVFTDVVALALMPERTAFAWAALLATGPANAAIARVLLRSAGGATPPSPGKPSPDWSPVPPNTSRSR
jgi:hypothetical protein